jgi:hypothetical protein
MALVLDGDNGIVGVLATNTDGDVIFDTDTLFVDAVENKVGIGTITPIRQLHLASSVPSIRLEDTDVSGAYNDIVHLSTGELSIRVDHGNVQSNSSLSFLIDADEKMRINTNGNVGIGTTSPLNKFVVAEGTGQHGVEIAPGTLSYIQAYDRATSDYGDLSIDAQTIRFATDNGAERMRITSTGVLQGTSDAEIATSPIRTHSNTISTSTTIDANDNAVASGPLAIADGVTLTINGNMTVV